MKKQKTINCYKQNLIETVYLHDVSLTLGHIFIWTSTKPQSLKKHVATIVGKQTNSTNRRRSEQQ